MAETQYCIPIIEDDLEINDDFFENFEAPKFVDFTAPDSCRPGDDSHWFCSRVGCDRKHEQELDSETVYKKFILRVMAARSPNVRFRKALNKREASANLKCPHSAPAKSRVSRMNFISSSSHKMTDKNVQVKPLSKVAATPNAKVRPSPPVAKALTTPRNNQKKALVFPSPKKEPETNSMSSLKEKKVKKGTQKRQRVVLNYLLKMSENEEMRNSVSAKGRVCESNMRKAEEKSLASSDDKENGRQLIENDDKENASIVHENIEMRTDNDKSSSTTTASPIGKYRKLKPTNPKPFKLRTDERGILKEANLDRKFLSPLKETAVKGGGSTMRKHQNRKSETIYTKSESDTDYYSSCDEKSRSKTQENQSTVTEDFPKCYAGWHSNRQLPLQGATALPRKKEKAVIATKLSVIIEKPSVKPKAAKPRSWARKALTVPIEPKFHRLHNDSRAMTGLALVVAYETWVPHPTTLTSAPPLRGEIGAIHIAHLPSSPCELMAPNHHQSHSDRIRHANPQTEGNTLWSFAQRISSHSASARTANDSDSEHLLQGYKNPRPLTFKFPIPVPPK
ncbi:uncharacterized protein HKW66_Vig0144880 [Vigna angularis]|uniref:Uncharacterized protein n=1 Tax=Phaseolus angularis TaxID=3914 RepID=A0A8T0KCC7_PHAAN|nr:uncharacterized protein HKW66_Vig0144880 [Vigna angularis]